MVQYYNHMERTVENDMEAGVMQGLVGVLTRSMVLDPYYDYGTGAPNRLQHDIVKAFRLLR